MASSLGLARMESPTHTESQIGSLSAIWASASISSMVVAPVMTPRFGSVSPNLTLRSPTVSTSSSVREQLGSQKPYDSLYPQDQKDDDAYPQDDVGGGEQPVPVTAFHAGGVEQPQQSDREEGQKHGPHSRPEEHQGYRLAEHDQGYRREGEKDQEGAIGRALF